MGYRFRELKVVVIFSVLAQFIGRVYAADLQPAISAFNEAQFMQAKPFFNAAATDPSSKNTALYYLGRIAFEEGAFEQAKEYLAQAVEIEPNTSEEYYWLGRAYGELAMRVGIIKQATYATSVHKYFQLAVDADPKNVEAQRGLFAFFIMAPSFMGGSVEKAESTLQSIRQVSPIDADIKTLDLLGKKEQADKQLAHAEFLVKTYPASAEALFAAANVFRNQKKMDLAIKYFETASKISINKQNKLFVETAIYQFGETCQWENRRVDEAIASVEKYLSIKSNLKHSELSWPQWTLAKLYFQKGDVDAYKRIRQQLDAEYIKQNKWMKEDMDKFDKQLKNKSINSQ